LRGLRGFLCIAILDPRLRNFGKGFFSWLTSQIIDILTDVPTPILVSTSISPFKYLASCKLKYNPKPCPEVCWF